MWYFGVLKVHEMLIGEIFLKIRNAEKKTILTIMSVACLPSSTAYLTSEAPTAQGPLVDMTILAVTFSNFSLFLEIIPF